MSHARPYRHLTSCTAIIAASLTGGVFTPRTVDAQQLRPEPVSAGLSVMQSFATTAPIDVVGHLVVDSRSQGVRPWAAVGVRGDGRFERSPFPVSSIGLRIQQQSWRLAIGLNQDVTYRSVRFYAGGGSDPQVTGMGGWSGGAPGPTPPTRVGYVPQPVADMVTWFRWGIPRVAVDLDVGWRFAGPDQGRPWLSATASTPLVARFALVAGVDQRDVSDATTHAAHLKVGLAWRSGSKGRARNASPKPELHDSATRVRTVPQANFVVRRSPHGIQLRFRAPMAYEVELRSDLTSWAPVAFQRDRDTIWQIDLPSTPGIHRLAIRIDGGPWQPPPGLQVGSDGYGDTVGLVVIEP